MSNKLSLIEGKELTVAAVDAAVKQAEANLAAIKLSEDMNIPLVDAKRILLKQNNATIEGRMDELSDNLGIIAGEAASKLHERLDDMDGKELIKVVAKATETRNLLQGKSGKIVEHKLTIGGKDPEAMRKALLNKTAIEVEAEVVND